MQVVSLFHRIDIFLEYISIAEGLLDDQSSSQKPLLISIPTKQSQLDGLVLIDDQAAFFLYLLL